VREDEGYLYCLSVLRSLPPNFWLVNEHVEPTFHFSAEQFERMRSELLKRMSILQELAPWPDPNYAIDDNWAAIYPYRSDARDAGSLALSLRILNHAPRPGRYQVKWNVPAEWKTVEADREVTIAPGKEGVARAVFTVKGAGLFVVTADVEFAGRQLREWSEGLVRVR
jgi:hypothetical protein